MNSQESPVIDPVLPAPVPPRGRLPLLKFLRTMPDNTIATFAQEAYEKDIVERKLFGRHLFIINDPAAIKQVLLDNVANYEKTETHSPSPRARPRQGTDHFGRRNLAAAPTHHGARL